MRLSNVRNQKPFTLKFSCKCIYLLLEPFRYLLRSDPLSPEVNGNTSTTVLTGKHCLGKAPAATPNGKAGTIPVAEAWLSKKHPLIVSPPGKFSGAETTRLFKQQLDALLQIYLDEKESNL